MKTPEYYYNIIMNADKTKEEWVDLQKEVNAWYLSADKETQTAFENMGVAETLAMLCIY